MSKNKRKRPALPSIRQSRRALFARIKAATVALVNAPDDLPARLQQSPHAPMASVDIIGSGFFVAPGFIATAKHVVQPWIDAFTAFQAGQGPQPQVPKFMLQGPPTLQGQEVTWGFGIGACVQFEYANAHDVAVVQVAVLAGEPTPLMLDDSDYEEGDEVGICGFPFGTSLNRDQFAGVVCTPSFSRGIVSAVLPVSGAPALLRTVFQVDATVNGGNSGGPVFDVATGRVIGVAIAAHNTEETVKAPAPAPPSGAGAAQAAVQDKVLKIPTGLARAVPSHHVKLVLAAMQGRIKTAVAAPPGGQAP